MNPLKVYSPYNKNIIRELPLNSQTDLEKALSEASALAKDPDRTLPPFQRMEILERCANLVEQRLEDYARQAAEEGGKPLIDSRVELKRAVQGIREAARSVNRVTGHEIPMGLTPSSTQRLAFTQREPIGVVVAVSAFNHPFNLIVHQVVPAVAVGCPVIVKPALTTPISCFNLVDCLYEAGLPEDFCRVLLLENELSEKLVTDSRVDFFSFIGSAKVGWWLRSRLSPGTRCTLEHGGAAPVIFTPSANLDSALPLLIKGGFYHAGQVCVSVQRVFAHEDVVARLGEGLTTMAQSLKVGDPLNENTEVGPLILEREVDRVHEWVEEARQSGAKILCGGKKLNETCYVPTVILNPPDSARVSCSEIFGPVINVYTYTDRKEAIARANAIPYSFQAAVFSKDIDEALDTANRLNASAVMVNDHTAFRVDWMPFAGRRESGLGVGGILPSMMEMTEEKMIVFKSDLIG